MDKYRIRKINLNNKIDFNSYINLKSLFLAEIRENNDNFENIIVDIQLVSKLNAQMNKICSDLPLLNPSLDIFLLEELTENSNDNFEYTPIAYTSVNKKIYGSKNNWGINPKETFEIENFFVLPEHRLNPHSLELLKFALKDISNENKKTVIFNALSSNPNRFFHFALADFVMIIQPITTDTSGDSTTYMYHLCCEDIHKIINLSTKELFTKAVSLQHQPTYENTGIPISLINELIIYDASEK